MFIYKYTYNIIDLLVDSAQTSNKGLFENLGILELAIM